MGSIGMRPIQVRAERDDDAPNGVRFELHENGGKVPNDTLESKKQPHHSKQNDFHEFRFILQEHGTNLKFQTPANAAITTANVDIEPVSVSPNGKMLEVKNFNRAESQDKFDLNFVKPDGTPVVFDPIWANQNGGV